MAPKDKKDTADKGSKPANLLPKEKKPRGKGKPFTPGFDERRNVEGSKPRGLTIIRQLIDEIADEKISLTHPVTQEKVEMTALKSMLWRMMMGKNSADHIDILNRGYGKVPDEVHVVMDMERFISENIDLFTDGQLQRLRSGEDPQNIVAELLRDAVAIMRSRGQEPT